MCSGEYHSTQSIPFLVCQEQCRFVVFKCYYLLKERGRMIERVLKAFRPYKCNCFWMLVETVYDIDMRQLHTVFCEVK